MSSFDQRVLATVLVAETADSSLHLEDGFDNIIEILNSDAGTKLIEKKIAELRRRFSLTKPFLEKHAFAPKALIAFTDE